MWRARALVVAAAAAVVALPPDVTAERSASCDTIPAWPAPEPTRPRYALALALDAGRRRVSGNERVRFTPDRPTDRLVFRLWANEPVLRTLGARLSVANVTVGGRKVRRRTQNPTTLVVRLGRTLGAGETVTATLRWALRLPRGGPDRIDSGPASIRLGSFFPLLS